MADGDPFLNLNAAMADYQKRYARLRNASSQESVRDVIGKLHDSMKVATEGLKDSLERLQSQNQERTKRIEERQAKAAKDLEAAIKTRDEALAKRAAKLAARKAREQPRPEPEDPELGARLRDKLLEEFGTRVDPPTPPSTGSSGSLIDYDPRSSQ